MDIHYSVEYVPSNLPPHLLPECWNQFSLTHNRWLALFLQLECRLRYPKRRGYKVRVRQV